MLKYAVLFWLGLAGLASADVGDVPLLPDGTVDLDAVLPTFHAQRRRFADGAENRFDGSIRGGSFTATYAEEPPSEPFELTVMTRDLSEHAVFLTYVLLNQIICDERDLRLGLLRWRETSRRVPGGWKVEASCRKKRLSGNS